MDQVQLALNNRQLIFLYYIRMYPNHLLLWTILTKVILFNLMLELEAQLMNDFQVIDQIVSSIFILKIDPLNL